MAEGKGSALARRSRPAQKVVAPRNKVNIALPLSMIRAEEPMTMRVGDWISLAGLVVSVIGWTPTGFVDTIRSGTMVYEERTGSGTGSQEVHPGI